MSGKANIAICLVLMLHFVSPLASAEEICLPPAGLISATSNENLKYLVFGEVHGSIEAPALFAESVCALVTSGKRVLVGLEFPEADAGTFQQFLRSAGGPEDVKNLLSGSSWSQGASQFPDGRTSQAMLDLVQRLRALRASGHELSIASFVRSVETQGESQTPYDKGLASSLIETESRGTYDLVMVLVGNVHASKAVVSFGTPFEPMAMHLPQSEALTLNMVSEGGTAWNCRPECGAHPMRASATDEVEGIVLGKELALGYDGVFNVGTTSASLPVAEAP
jgi:hypothetical protein